MTHPIVDGLNNEQREAVLQTRGPLLVLAGAGSGKTRVITHRIAWILEQGANQTEILAVTFTNKAAAEMRERVSRLLGGEQPDLLISTFHSLGLHLLRREAGRLGMNPRSSILDEEDRAGIIRQVMADHSVLADKDNRGAFLDFLQRVKGEGAEPMTASRVDGPIHARILLRMFRDYQARLAICRSWDFDDLIWLAVRLLKSHDDVRERYSQRFRFIMVDEYQDTNMLQFRLLKQLSSAWGNLCVVGDDDQSIYRWRGARVENILEFDSHFPDARIIKLTRNYRSNRTILDLANGLIRNNSFRRDKDLWTERDDRIRVKIVSVPDEDREAEVITNEIATLIQQEEARPGQMAVLYRTRGQARRFEEFCHLYNVPYRVIGSFDFFARKEVRDALAYLKLLSNPDDDASLMRVVNHPPRGIGMKTLAEAHEIQKRQESSLWRALQSLHKEGSLPARTRRGLERFLRVMRAGRSRVEEAPKKELVACIREILAETGLRDHLVSERATGWEATEAVLRLLDRSLETGQAATLEAFLEKVALDVREREHGDTEDPEDLVSLITLHAAKGLEFERVYIAGMVEGLLPHVRATESRADLEEERRLAYVGITRARTHLTLSHFNTRMRRGEPMSCVPSRFLTELPSEKLDRTTRRKDRDLSQDEVTNALNALLNTLSD